MKLKAMSKPLRRLIWLAAVSSCLLIAMLFTRQHKPAEQLVIPVVEASGEQQESNTSTARRHSYGEAIGLQHEQRDKSKQAAREEAALASSDESSTSTVSSKQDDVISQDGPVITVHLSEEERLEQVPIEQYVLGVALAELPGSFEPEAIKAQMLAIRTYIVHRLVKADDAKQPLEIEVTDTTADQVYMPLKKVTQYAEDYPEYYAKFVKALLETEGQIISYEEQPIDAVFFSTSNGYTEAADQLWGQEVAYLQSVASPWDEQLSPNYETEFQFTYEEVYTKLNLKQSRRNGKLAIANTVKNDSGRIQSLDVNGASFTGKELREKLGLTSTDMTWTIDPSEKIITFKCYGYGHGIGLSQWGANGMAKTGYLAADIIKHYYTGVHIEQASKLVKNY